MNSRSDIGCSVNSFFLLCTHRVSDLVLLAGTVLLTSDRTLVELRSHGTALVAGRLRCDMGSYDYDRLSDPTH